MGGVLVWRYLSPRATSQIIESFLPSVMAGLSSSNLVRLQCSRSMTKLGTLALGG